MVRGRCSSGGDSMLGLILDLKNHLEAVFGIVALVATAYRFVVKPVWTRVQRIDAAIGFNGGSSLFDQIEKLNSLADMIDRPILFISSEGEVESVNMAFTEHTGWAIESLRRGGWRQLFGRDDQDEWDEIVQRKSVFSRDVSMRGKAYHLTAKPVVNVSKFLGWRAVLTPKDAPRRRMTDQP